MKASLKWINEYVNIDDLNINELANKMTLAGLEVESISYLAQGDKLVIGEVIDCQEHIESDHLHVCKVDIGDEILQIVCGAPNVAKGQRVIVALEGAYLPAIDLTIKKAKIRNVESNGMICSLSELGVDDKYLSEEQLNGIEVLPSDAKVGETNVLSYLGLDDVTFELKLTPDRGDCNSIYSLAKDIGAILNRPVKPLEAINLKEVKPTLKCISQTPSCQLFKIKTVRDIKVKESPDYIKKYLMACGIRSINNVVDIGNYVMLLTGQPLHMYDLNKLKSDTFIVKDDYECEFKALDEQLYQLQKGDICITNGDDIGCLGGVMGSFSTMIDENTTGVAIEAAHFKGAQIRRTSTRLQLISDSSIRFTKGTDINRCDFALNLAAALLVKEAGAQMIEETVSYDVLDHKEREVEVTLTSINSLLGTNFSLNDVSEVFDALDFKYELKDETFKVTIPSYRNDISIDADLIEEIIRIKGFEHLPLTVPSFSSVGALNDVQNKRRIIRTHLTSIGLNEAMTYTLVDEKKIEDFHVLNRFDVIKVLHPMSDERAYLRKSIVPSLLATINYNLSRNISDVNLYEISNVYGVDRIHEYLAITLCGTLNNVPLYKTAKSDFYTIKGIVESVLGLIGIEQPRYQYSRVEKDNNYYHPGKSVYLYVGKTRIGVIGLIHPLMAKKYEVKDVYVAELDLDEILKMKTSQVKFTPLIPYPPMTRDIAVVVKDDVEVESILKIIKKGGKGLITDINVFDVYQGENIEQGYKSIAISLTYQDKNKTLKDNEVNEVQNKIISSLEKVLDAKLRT